MWGLTFLKQPTNIHCRSDWPFSPPPSLSLSLSLSLIDISDVKINWQTYLNTRKLSLNYTKKLCYHTHIHKPNDILINFTRQWVAVDSLKLKTTDQVTQNNVAKNGNPATMLLKVEKCTRNRVECSFAIPKQLKWLTFFLIIKRGETSKRNTLVLIQIREPSIICMYSSTYNSVTLITGNLFAQ